MKIALSVLGLAVAAAALLAYYVVLGSSWNATTDKDITIFGSEHDAAYAGSTNIKTAPPLSRAEKGETLAVLWDAYGKDYWACYVRTQSGERGWVLCTDLQQLS